MVLFLLDDKDQKLHDISDWEPENKLREFNNLLDLEGSTDMDGNFVYDDDILSEENIHQINANLGYLH